MVGSIGGGCNNGVHHVSAERISNGRPENGAGANAGGAKHLETARHRRNRRETVR